MPPATALNTTIADDDSYGLIEDDLGFLNLGTTLLFNVMANDGNSRAKFLYSVDDGNTTGIDPSDLLNADSLVNGISAWETTDLGNQVRINNGQLEFDVSTTLASLGANNINGLNATDIIEDSVVYAIRLGNGVLSWARVTFQIQGQNDLASMTGDISAALDEDTPGLVSGVLTVSDADRLESHTQPVLAALGSAGLGSYSVDSDGNWSYDVDNGLLQHLAEGDSVSDSFTVWSFDGTASQVVTINIAGVNDGPTAEADAVSITEDGAILAGSVAGNDGDVDDGASLSYALAMPLDGLTLNADGSFTLDPAAASFQHLAKDQVAIFNAAYTVTDEHGASAGSTLSITVTGVNDAPEISEGDTDISIDSSLAIQGGNEFIITPNLGVNQGFQTITTLTNGNYLVVWARLVDGAYDVIGQMFAPSGTEIGGEMVLNSNTTGIQELSWVSALANGGFVVTWQESWSFYQGKAVYVRTFDAAGTPTSGDILVGTPTVPTASQTTTLMPTVEGLSDGRFVVAWEDYDAVTGGVRVQIYNANGTPSGGNTVLGSPQPGQSRPDIASTEDGRFVVVWDDDNQTNGDTSGYAVLAQIFNSDGSLSGGPVLVNTTTNGVQRDASIAMLSDDRFVVTWYDGSMSPDDSSVSAIRAQLFDMSGDKVGTEFLVNTSTSGNQFWPHVVALSSGAFMITWTEQGQTDGDISGTAVQGQLFDADGNKVGQEFIVSSTTNGNQWDVVSTALDNGQIASVWWTELNQLASRIFQVTELPTAMEVTGALNFTDPELSDVHAVSVAPPSLDYIGHFTANLADDSTGDGTGSIDWAFVADQSDLDEVLPGDTVMQTYSVALDDGNGGVGYAIVNISIEKLDSGPFPGSVQVNADWYFA